MAKRPVYGYCRVSTVKQSTEGHSLENQKEQIERFCNHEKGYDLKGIYSESLSGKNEDRPQLQEALRLCRLSNGLLIVAKIDRLTRDLHFLTKLQKEGVEFLALDMPSANKAMLQVMITFAEFDNELRSTRIKEGMAKAKQKGKTFGTDNLTPYWNKLEDEIDPEGRRHEVRKLLEKPSELDPEEYKKLKTEEAELINKVRELRGIKPAMAKQDNARQRALNILPLLESAVDEGLTSYSAWAKYLTDRSILTPRGHTEWDRQKIQTLINTLKGGKGKDAKPIADLSKIL